MFAEKFAESFSPEERGANVFLGLLPGRRILDVGCGIGLDAQYFQNLGYEVKCIDISDSMVASCREKGLDACVIGMEEIDFCECFDGVWAMYSLLHIPKSRAGVVVDRFHAALRENGILHLGLREGDWEGYDEHGRFKALWSVDELLDLACTDFVPLNLRRHEFGAKSYLQLTARKRDSLL